MTRFPSQAAGAAVSRKLCHASGVCLLLFRLWGGGWWRPGSFHGNVYHLGTHCWSYTHTLGQAARPVDPRLAASLLGDGAQHRSGRPVDGGPVDDGPVAGGQWSPADLPLASGLQEHLDHY